MTVPVVRTTPLAEQAGNGNLAGLPVPAFEDGAVTVYHGDSFDILPWLEDAAVHTVVTDPPYGLDFMGKAWDSFDRSPRQMHGTGGSQAPFGNHSVRLGAARARTFQEWCERWAVECLRVLAPGGHLVAFGGSRTWHRLVAALEDAGFEIRDSIAWLYGSGFPKSLDVGRVIGLPEGRWRGWGTGLKPAFEPIVIARKPLAGTVAATVEQFGTGALHIDVCRVPATARPVRVDHGQDTPGKTTYGSHGPGGGSHAAGVTDEGRWPPNVVLTHAANCRKDCADDCPVAALDAQSGVLRSGANPSRRHSDVFRDCYGHFPGAPNCRPIRGADCGGAARFFPAFRWQAKASSAERPRIDGQAHPTVKPLELVRWLIRLVTADGGVVLDPFLGSGTTAEAAQLEGVRCIGIEREADYLPLIEARLKRGTSA
jgi:site-specific DNA-methyltransferase (adenine-specific)